MARKGRNYKAETAYESTPEQVKNRVARNKARRAAIKAGKVHKGDNKEVDHKRPLALGGGNSPDNWRVVSRHTNRAAGASIRERKQRRG